MEKIDLIKPDTLKDLLFKKFEDAPPLHEEVDPLSNGDFEVIKQLLTAVPEAVRAKDKMDKIIDKCGNPPRGVGIQNLRTCIAETKWKFDVSPEERQGAFKVMIINFIERYFYLICFATYAKKFGPDGFNNTGTLRHPPYEGPPPHMRDPSLIWGVATPHMRGTLLTKFEYWTFFCVPKI